MGERLEVTLANIEAYHRLQAVMARPKTARPWHDAAARQLEALAGHGWIEAPGLPAALEGLLAWRWLRWDGAMEIVRIPRGYDRRSLACGGVWFYPIPMPDPPLQLEGAGFKRAEGDGHERV